MSLNILKIGLCVEKIDKDDSGKLQMSTINIFWITKLVMKKH